MINILEVILTDSLPSLKTENIKNLSTYQLAKEANILEYPISGIPIYTPYGFKIFHKMETLLREKAKKYGLTELLLSILQSQSLFQQSGRYEVFQSDIFNISEKGRYILSPTSEEQIISFLSNRIRGYKSFPLYLYQIRQLFRNNNAHGITRNKEFIVFESYCFHLDLESSLTSFSLYDNFFREFFLSLGITFFINKKSDSRYYTDYLFLTADGEYKFMPELLKEKIPGYDGGITKASSIGMGMLVDQTISQKFGFKVNLSSSKLGEVFVGTFGIGLIRAFTAILEQQRDEKGVRLPICLQPYAAIFIPEKSDEIHLDEALTNYLNNRKDILMDNRKCDRKYKINYAFFIGVSKVIYAKKSVNGHMIYYVIHRNGKLDECYYLEQLNEILNSKYPSHQVKNSCTIVS